MARLPRFSPAGLPQHVIQRGNNRSACFAAEQDFSAYANWLKEYSVECGVAVHAWVFMTNHVHLLLTPETDGALSDMMQALGRRYVRYFKKPSLCLRLLDEHRQLIDPQFTTNLFC
ncbi:transposase [uncultured Porticoccus sp.]|uniref:transposase n=1 Tax=uncultured Porticoccus sp. TaxID=1256050 RepID=UPI00262853CD|nr:transposase [uncultured Porticoccus sp.]